MLWWEPEPSEHKLSLLESLQPPPENAPLLSPSPHSPLIQLICPDWVLSTRMIWRVSVLTRPDGLLIAVIFTFSGIGNSFHQLGGNV